MTAIRPASEAVAQAAARLRARFARLPLVLQFLVAGGVVMLAALLVIGSWITERIEQSVVDNTASATALYVEAFISPSEPGARRLGHAVGAGAAGAAGELRQQRPPRPHRLVQESGSPAAW